jgi:hypothetical protein
MPYKIYPKLGFLGLLINHLATLTRTFLHSCHWHNVFWDHERYLQMSKKNFKKICLREIFMSQTFAAHWTRLICPIISKLLLLNEKRQIFRNRMCPTMKKIPIIIPRFIHMRTVNHKRLFGQDQDRLIEGLRRVGIRVGVGGGGGWGSEPQESHIILVGAFIPAGLWLECPLLVKLLTGQCQIKIAIFSPPKPGRPDEFVKKSPKMLPDPFFANINTSLF